MNNADMPAMPFSQELKADVKSQRRAMRADTGPTVYAGLTKRETFAMHAMSATIINDCGNDESYKHVAEASVAAADALLKALETE